MAVGPERSAGFFQRKKDQLQRNIRCRILDFLDIPDHPSRLSRPDILRHLKEGNLIIYPFEERNLGTVSYDVTLGENFYRFKEGGLYQRTDGSKSVFFNPFSKRDIEQAIDGPYQAQTLEKVILEELGLGSPGEYPHDYDYLFEMERRGWLIEGVFPQDKVITLSPGEMILGHTNEVIGGKEVITTIISGRSSLGRGMVEVCNDAFIGGVGYINCFTLEIRNKSKIYTLILPAGRRIAQVSFELVSPVSSKYEERKYHVPLNKIGRVDPEKIFKDWMPEMMLPRTWEDWELRNQIREIMILGKRLQERREALEREKSNEH